MVRKQEKCISDFKIATCPAYNIPIQSSRMSGIVIPWLCPLLCWRIK